MNTDPDTTPDDALKWHLVLHLARQTEETADEADVMLSQLKDLKSPLGDAIGDDMAAGSLFDDLTPFNADPLSDSNHVRGIMDAWMGLFGAHLSQYDTLVTLSPGVMGHVTGLFGEPYEAEDIDGSDGPEVAPRIMRCTFPALPENAALDKHDPVGRLSGKTLMLFEL